MIVPIGAAVFLGEPLTADYGLFPQCPANETTISLVFLPAAYLLSVFDLSLGWSLLHVIPLIVVLGALGVMTLFVVSRGSAAASLLLASAFIGVAGSGLILLRYAAALILHGIACLAGYALIHRVNPGPIVTVVYLILATLAALLSLFVQAKNACSALARSCLRISRTFQWWRRAGLSARRCRATGCAESRGPAP